VMDMNQARIDAWNSDKLPIYEPGLEEIVKEARGRNLFFTTDCDKAVREADIVFVCVNTPTKTTGIGAGLAADLTYWEGAARMIARASLPGQRKIIVEKSTVPIKTAEAIETVLAANLISPDTQFDILSNPEFLAEGTAIEDLKTPDRVLIGSRMTESGLKACNDLKNVYARWIPEERILMTNVWSAELAKLAANAMLAQRVSSMNTFSAICEATGADVQEISRAVGTDSRLGPKFLSASVGFGGSCFQKDILNLVYIAQSIGLTTVAQYWKSVIEINDWQKERFASKVVSTLFNTVKGKKIAVLGFAFKKDTSDTRETAAIDVCNRLIEDGANCVIYDPMVPEEQILSELSYTKFAWDHPLSSEMDANTKKKLKQHVSVATSAVEACKDAHAVLVITEWDEFKTVDWPSIYKTMLKPASVFDGRTILDHASLRQLGFNVYAIGKPSLGTETV
jgi:UDPglucose 6-dehydrogenase